MRATIAGMTQLEYALVGVQTLKLINHDISNVG